MLCMLTGREMTIRPLPENAYSQMHRTPSGTA